MDDYSDERGMKKLEWMGGFMVFLNLKFREPFGNISMGNIVRGFFSSFKKNVEIIKTEIENDNFP